MKTRETGNKAELLAAKRLKRLRYKILERNFSSRYGEIDIIARDGEYIVFVEVRYRHSEEHGSGAETVDIYKRKKIIKTAEYYLLKNNETDSPARFDVVSMTGDLDAKCKIEVIKNAFDVNS